MGITKPDGKIYVDTQVVGTNVMITARWNSTCSTPFAKITSTIWAHSYTCFFNDTFPNGVPTLVHFDASGKADFADWAPCDNVLKFTPVTPPVQHSLTCDLLEPPTKAAGSSTVQGYDFVAHATGNNAPITKYVFDFGDHSSDTVVTSRGTATDFHNYALTDVAQSLTATVTVFSTQFPQGKTSPACSKPVSVPSKPSGGTGAGSELSCSVLSANPTNDNKTIWEFTVTANPPVNTTIKDFTFNFDNGQNVQTVPTSDTTAKLESVSFSPGTTHHVQATVEGPLGAAPNVANCATDINVPGTVLATSVTKPTPTALVPTGPGNVIGLFGLVSVAGGLFHHFVLRRKLLA